jgi:hypothetical protein
MPLKFNIGANVRQVVPLITGNVVGAAIVDGDVQFKVSWTDANGDSHMRMFTEDQIEATPVPPEHDTAA